MAQPGPINFLQGTGCGGPSVLQFCIAFDVIPGINIPVDVSTVTTSGTADFWHEPTLFQDLGQTQKMYFSLDPSQSGTVNVSFQADILYTVSSDLSYLQGYAPLDPNSVTFAVEPDCGNGSGEITIGLNEGAEISFFVVYTVDGSILTSPDLAIPDLAAGDYVVLMQDLLCPTLSQAFFNPPVTVPDGSFTVDVTTVNPIVNCTSSTAEASGVVSGAVELEVTGGSGFFNSFDLNSSFDVNHGPIEILTSLSSASGYSVATVDLVTGCAVQVDFSLEEVDASIDINFDVTNGLCISGTGTWPPVVTQNGMVVASESSSLLDFDFNWDDPSSTSGSTLTYSALDVYTVTASIVGETCEVSADFDSSSSANLNQGDLNGDGLIGAADLSVFLGVFGTFCTTPASGCQGDFNGDGIINDTDRTILFSLFGTAVDCGN